MIVFMVKLRDLLGVSNHWAMLRGLSFRVVSTGRKALLAKVNTLYVSDLWETNNCIESKAQVKLFLGGVKENL